MSKDRIMRIIVVITSFFAGAAYFFKYVSESSIVKGFNSTFGGLGALFGVDVPDADFSSGLFSVLDDGLMGWLLLIPCCIVPLVLLLLTVIFNIVNLVNGKLKKASNIIAIIACVLTFDAAWANCAYLIIRPAIGPGIMLWIQLVLVIVCLVLSSILCHWTRKGRIGQIRTTPLSPKDVAIIGLRGGAGGQVFMLNDDECVSIGRDPQQCNIIVPGSSANVSRKHCVIHYDFDRSAYMVMDTSSNGTFVYENGQKKRLPLGVEVPVAAGNVIMLGDELTTFRLN
ncbi:MAG: FHA domain-containing protein [Clostridia bacterium]